MRRSRLMIALVLVVLAAVAVVWLARRPSAQTPTSVVHTVGRHRVGPSAVLIVSAKPGEGGETVGYVLGDGEGTALLRGDTGLRTAAWYFQWDDETDSLWVYHADKGVTFWGRDGGAGSAFDELRLARQPDAAGGMPRDFWDALPSDVQAMYRQYR